MKFKMVESIRVKRRSLEEDQSMPNFKLKFTVDGVKSEETVHAVNVQEAQELIKKKYNGQSINFTSSQQIKEISEDFEDPAVVKEDAVEESERVPQTDETVGLSNMIIQEINGEWETIQHYNDLIALMREQGYDNMIDVISDIVAEENTHIGQLQKCLQVISPNVSKIEAGETEAIEQLDDTDTMTTNIANNNLAVMDMECDGVVDDDFGTDSGFDIYLV